MNLSAGQLLKILQGFPSVSRYHLAFSGGLDSTVLLHLLAELQDRLAGSLHALYVHHGLQAEADAWGLHCRQVCQAHSIPFTQLDLKLFPHQGESLEALARDARYTALAAAMGRGEMLLTAQHQNDQAETLLLQLLRGVVLPGWPQCPGRPASVRAGWCVPCWTSRAQIWRPMPGNAACIGWKMRATSICGLIETISAIG